MKSPITKSPQFRRHATTLAVVTCLAALGTSALSQDWPQWRGPAGSASAAFKAPKTWPKSLTQKWKISVGDGVASPALVGDRIYLFSRQDENEVLRCLALSDGKELWQDRYESLGATGPASGFSGPRSTPVVARGKVVTVGVRGMISCLDAGAGQKLWRKDDFRSFPNFHPSSSPMVIDELAIAQLGGRENGAVIAYDLATGAEKWRRSGAVPSYASPALMSVGGAKLVIAQTDNRISAVNAANGELAWESEAAPAGGPGGPGGGGPGGGRGGGGRDYRAATPVVAGDTAFIAGRGIRALQFRKEGNAFSAKELWNNGEKSVQFSTPTLQNGLLFALSPANELFCLDAKDGKALWSAALSGGAPLPGGPGGPGRDAGATQPRADYDGFRIQNAFAGSPTAASSRLRDTRNAAANKTERRLVQAPPDRPDGPPRGPGGPGGPGGRRGFGGGPGGGSGYGTIVDAGSVLFVLTPRGELLVVEPSRTEFKQLASYPVGTQTHAYPVARDQRILIKDKDSLALWAVE